MKKEEKHKLFAGFYANNLTKKEEEAFLASEEAEELLLKQWEDNQEYDVEPDSKKLFANIQQSIHSSKKQSVYISLIAAAIMVFFTLAIAGVYFFSPMNENNLVEYQTEKGQRLEVQLPDGSTVWLNSASSIRFNKNFNKRNVTLSGEAFFDVKKSSQTFIVEAQNYNVEVLGTQFTVNSYKDASKSYTVLKEGKVNIIFDENNTYELTPNQQFEYNKISKTTRILKVNADPYTTWTMNKLVFDNTPLHVIVEQLEKWYGIEIEAEKNVNLEKRFTLTVHNEDPMKVFSLFGEIEPLAVKKEQNTLILAVPN